MIKKANPKPYRQLLPVIIILTINLVIYLYVIATNTKTLNLFSPKPQDISNIIILASYPLTATGMLLTLTSYFSIKSYVKKNSDNVNITKTSERKVDDKKERFTIIGKIFGKREKQDKTVISVKKSGTDKIENTVTKEKESSKSLNDQNNKKEKELTPVVVQKQNWKKIEVKLSESTSADTTESKNSEVKKQESEKKLTSEEKIKSLPLMEAEAVQQPVSEKKEEIKKIEEATVDAQIVAIIDDINKNIVSLSDKNENVEKLGEISEAELQNSEVIQTLQELKVMINDMKTSMKNKNMI
jgi:hypothetical protein